LGKARRGKKERLNREIDREERREEEEGGTERTRSSERNPPLTQK
jgi:hypothetical protein